MMEAVVVVTPGMFLRGEHHVAVRRSRGDDHGLALGADLLQERGLKRLVLAVSHLVEAVHDEDRRFSAAFWR